MGDVSLWLRSLPRSSPLVPARIAGLLMCGTPRDGYLDAVALLTASDAEDDAASAYIWTRSCPARVTEALIVVCLSLLDEMDLTVADLAERIHSMELDE